MNIDVTKLANEKYVREMIENGIILTDDEIKTLVEEYNKTVRFFRKKTGWGMVSAYHCTLKNIERKNKMAELKNINKMASIAEENKLLNVLNTIAENGTTKKVKRDVPICIEALETLPNPEQLFTEDNKHTLLADLHIIRNILNEVKYADGKNSREAWDMNGDSEMVLASQYMGVADAVNNINSALHVKKLGYEMPSKDWETFNLINVDVNLKGFRSFKVEFDDACDVKHVLKVMLGVFEAINDFENADEVKRVLNNL